MHAYPQWEDLKTMTPAITAMFCRRKAIIRLQNITLRQLRQKNITMSKAGLQLLREVSDENISFILDQQYYMYLFVVEKRQNILRA